MVHFFVLLFASQGLIHAEKNSGAYDQIIPLMTQKINIAQPTESDQEIMNASRAFLEHGTYHAPSAPEAIKTVASTHFYTDILHQFFATATVSGKIQTGLLAAQLTDDINILSKRQSLIKYLHQNPGVRNALQQILGRLAPAEKAFFELFQTIDPKSQLESELMQGRHYFTSELCKPLNHSSSTLELCKRSKYLNPGLIALSFPLSIVLQYRDMYNTTFLNALDILLSDCKQFSQNFDSLPTELKIRFGGYVGILSAYMGLVGYMTVADIKKDFDFIHMQQKRLLALTPLLHEIRNLESVFNNNPELQVLMPDQYQSIHDFIHHASPAVQDLMDNLGSSSFQGSDSYYVSRQGKILSTHYKLSECKNELVPYLEAFGRIDAYVTIANLYSAYEHNPKISFCFPNYVEASAPVMTVHEYWHPMIEAQKIVTNDIDMNPRTACNMIITGPNAGGKTTSLMALVLNIVFAQSFCIAPSKSLSLTPFAKIHSYLDITTNLQEGLSLFAAEVDRAKKLKESIMSCAPGQKTFTVIDEIFSGTNQDVASEIGTKFAKQLGEIPHSMTIITTHIPKLTQIEREHGSFMNYKVADATIMPDGSIVYPFKLVKGISTQNIAEHMLEIQGII